MPDQRTTASRSDSDGTECTDPDSHRRDDGTTGRERQDTASDSADAASDDFDNRSENDGVDAADQNSPAVHADASDADDVDTTGPDHDDSDDADTADSERFRKLDDAEYDRVNDFLREYVDFTAREWAVARLCADFRTGTGVPMKTVGEELPELVPFVTEPYTRQAVYEARRSFEDRVRRAAATFLYGANSGFLTAEEVDDVLYEAREVATFLLEVEGTALSHDVETAAEAATLAAMRSVHEASLAVRYDECPDCGARLDDDPA